MRTVKVNKTTLINFSNEDLEKLNVPSEVIIKSQIEETMKKRTLAYASSSDPLFMEAIRKDAAGDIEGAEAARAQALQAVDDIKAKYPLPVDE